MGYPDSTSLVGTFFPGNHLSGSKRWEEQQPEVAEALRQLAEAHAQQDPTFESTIAYTRLTAAEAITQLRAQGFSNAQLPSPSTMAEILNRMGYRLRKVVKAKPKKKLPETNEIFDNIKKYIPCGVVDEDSGQLYLSFGSSYKIF